MTLNNRFSHKRGCTLSHSSLSFFFFIVELDVHGIESRSSTGTSPSVINHGFAQQAQLHLDTC